MNQNTFNHMITLFQKTTDRTGQLVHINDLLICKEDRIFHHSFNRKRSKSDSRSISKTVLTLALGVVITQSEQGKLPKINEETFIYPIIKKMITLENKHNKSQLKKVKIKHLLTHTVGYDDVLLMRDDIRHIDPYEYLNYVMNYPIVHEPGEYYLYSNAGFYLLAVVLQEFSQENLLSFIERELFHPLGITDYNWEMYGHYIAGATRLWLYAEDLLSIGKLLLHDGKIENKQLVSTSWIRKMLTISHYTPDVDSPHMVFRRYAYGYGIWLAKERFYFGHGTDGQTLTILPEKKTIILTLAEQPDIKPIEKMIDYIITDLL